MNPRLSALLRALVAAGSVALFFILIGRRVPDFSRGVHITKLVLAVAAAGFFFYEERREGERRPVAERWKRFAGVSLGIASIALYFNGFKLGYVDWYHRHDQFHYYIGAKYFPELGYDHLYRCAAVAEDELGVVSGKNGRRLDLKKEVRHADWKIRDLGRTNLLIPAGQVLDEPEVCKAPFSPERWEAFKNDIKFFRVESDKDYWERMQRDHGYNPPPVWTLAGRFLAERVPISVFGAQLLGAIDVAYMLGMLGALYWAFGWRVFSVAAIFWGCEGAADPYYWTGGAFLRQDWLFFSVLAVCLTRKGYHALAGAAFVYAALLRIFPGLMVVGWLVVAGATLVKKRRLSGAQLRTLFGGTAAAAILVGASLTYVGKDSFQAFYRHTIVVHDSTPLTNHMGLRVLLSHRPGSTFHSGRMKYVRDEKLVDPFMKWKDMRNERTHRYRWVGWLVCAATLAAFVRVVGRVKHLWVAQGMSACWVILLSQLTNYYYGFFLCAIPLILLEKRLELVVLGYVILSQSVHMSFSFYDDRHAVMTLIALAFSFILVGTFWPRKRLADAKRTEGPPAPLPEVASSA